MGRKRLYQTPEEKLQANRLKSRKHYEKNKAVINAKRRRGEPKPPPPLKKTSTKARNLHLKPVGLTENSKEFTKSHGEEGVKDVHGKGEPAQHPRGPRSSAKPLKAPSTSLVKEHEHVPFGTAKSPVLSIDQDENQKLLDGDDDAWHQKWQADARIKAQRQYNESQKKQPNVYTLKHFLDLNFVKAEPSLDISQPLTIEEEMDNRPLWVREYEAARNQLRDQYKSLGATKLSEYLPKLYHGHVNNFRNNGYPHLLGDHYDFIGDLEQCLRVLHNKVQHRYGNEEPTGYYRRLLDKVVKLTDQMNTMWMSDIIGTEGLIRDYEAGLLPFQD